MSGLTRTPPDNFRIKTSTKSSLRKWKSYFNLQVFEFVVQNYTWNERVKSNAGNVCSHENLSLRIALV